MNKAKSVPFVVFVYVKGVAIPAPSSYTITAWGDYFLPFFQSACLAIRRI